MWWISFICSLPVKTRWISKRHVVAQTERGAWCRNYRVRFKGWCCVGGQARVWTEETVESTSISSDWMCSKVITEAEWTWLPLSPPTAKGWIWWWPSLSRAKWCSIAKTVSPKELLISLISCSKNETLAWKWHVSSMLMSTFDVQSESKQGFILW